MWGIENQASAAQYPVVNSVPIAVPSGGLGFLRKEYRAGKDLGGH